MQSLRPGPFLDRPHEQLGHTAPTRRLTNNQGLDFRTRFYLDGMADEYVDEAQRRVLGVGRDENCITRTLNDVRDPVAETRLMRLIAQLMAQAENTWNILDRDTATDQRR